MAAATFSEESGGVDSPCGLPHSFTSEVASTFSRRVDGGVLATVNYGGNTAVPMGSGNSPSLEGLEAVQH